MYSPIVFVVLLFLTPIKSDCNHPIYCQGDLLNTVQTARIFKDQKTFVDLKLKLEVNATLTEWVKFKEANPTPSNQALKSFVKAHFKHGKELEEWVPDDFNPSPSLLKRINNPEVATFAGELIQLWKILARRIKNVVFVNPDRYSIIPVRNGFVIPGGRFREFYYWDSYWIVLGLLESEMFDTVRGILENFLLIVEAVGFVPNGARCYYLDRSQPPLLTPMIYQWFVKTKNGQFIVDNLETMEKEMNWWLENRVVGVVIDGITHKIARYASAQESPRPESLYEDQSTATFFADPKKQLEVYKDLRSGAESGNDFTSRWIVDPAGYGTANLSYINTRNIIPVDLNAILVMNFNIISDLYKMVGNNHTRAEYWANQAEQLLASMQRLLYNELDGIWYDYCLMTGAQRSGFYATNFVPLWADILPKNAKQMFGAKAVAYLEKQGILEYQGGIPSSLVHSGEQWDFPNAWAPLQDFVVKGLLFSGDERAKEVATELGKRWIKANMIGFNETGEMFEKYDAVNPGKYGGGGEYVVQSGFGWTNGVALDFISKFFTN